MVKIGSTVLGVQDTSSVVHEWGSSIDGNASRLVGNRALQSVGVMRNTLLAGGFDLSDSLTRVA